MSDHIPFEIQVEIMKRLPVKSLAVSRSISKAWKSMIDSPLFIADHTNMRQHHRLLIGMKFKPGFEYVSIMDNGTLSQHEFETFSNVPVSFQQLFYKRVLPILVGTSQGLLCLFGYSEEDDCYKKAAVIWNPSLGKSIAVSVPDLQPYMDVLGFGVRPDNFDPMIVMIGNVAHPNRVLVFTLSSRVWRVPRGNLPPKSISFIYLSPVATDDRCIYWKAYDYEGSINLVVAFDMVSEDFTTINLPNSVAKMYYDDFSISKIKESLALLDYDYVGYNKRVCGVWMMVEDGVSKSFTKLFTINTPDASLKTRVLGFRKNDQAIMETEYGVYASLEVYEPRTGAIKNLGINGAHDSFFCCSYTETLLLLDQLDVKVQFQL